MIAVLAVERGTTSSVLCRVYYVSTPKVNINIKFLSVSVYYEGSQLTVWHSDDAAESQAKAEERCNLACATQLDALIKRLAERGRLSSNDQFVNEGDGIWAIKTRCGLRAYGWFHRTQRGIFVISHYINKKRQKMLRADIDRVNKNRKISDPGD